ncbi:hypothetical protein V5799_012415 [Amblyomma americanum]|uniref:Tnf receptor-associated factor n=1 Tax=Amblyomma americanum TaxID=6943 RepID=A0AAQ4EES7_AMBAM
MAEPRWMLRYRVLGFGDHVDQKTVAFLEEPEDLQVCSWCGGVSKAVYWFPCSHVVCNVCTSVASQAEVCLIDKAKLPGDMRYSRREDNSAEDKQVRCLNVDGGCEFTGRLGDLDEHLRKACAFYMTTCSRCGDKVAYKDVRAHYTACKSAVGVFIHDADARSLLEGLANVRKEIDQALRSSSDDNDGLRTALKSAGKRFAALDGELAKGVPGHAKAAPFAASRLQE